VEIEAFRGARVRRPSLDELLEAYVVRSELEALVVRLAVPRLTDDDVVTLAGYLAAMDRAAETGDVVAEAAADASFHGCLVHAANNGTLERVWGLLEPYLRTYISLAVPGADRRRIAGLHVPILEALRARDVVAAEAAIRHHFVEAKDMLAALWLPSAPGGIETASARRPREAPGA
jgi:DNA-binding GntR family transcriptional regulator